MTARARTNPSIAAISYALPGATSTVRELAAAGAVDSSAELLERFGFDRVRVAVEETPYDLALSAARALLDENDIDSDSIEAVIYGGTPGTLAFATQRDAPRQARGLCGQARFQYPGTRLQFDLGLERSFVLGVDQLACTTLFAAVRLARALCMAEGLERVLCVASEFYPSEAGREAITNCTSDAACAVLVTRNGERNRIVATTTVTKGFFWRGNAMKDEVIASYFPTAVNVMRQTIADAGWSPSDVDWVIPHNVSTKSWEILMGLAALPGALLYSDNIARLGHTLAGDNFINLRDGQDAGVIVEGQKVLLFSYGYGAHWTGLALEA